MCITDVSDPFTAFSGIGTGKGHNLYPVIHHPVNDRRDDLSVSNIHTDDIIVFFFGIKKPLCLIFGRCLIRCHILVGDRDSPVKVLSLRFFHSKRHSIPPGMNGFICEIEIIAVLLRFIGIQLMLKIYRIMSRIICFDGICPLYNKILRRSVRTG